MASLGFRHPQFSEDSAWLPVWLQRCQLEASGERIEESETSISRAFKNSAILHGNIGEGEEQNLSSRQEGRYNSCHLFLSAEDNSTTIAPSPGNDLHFALHLSSNGESQYTQSVPFNASQNCFGSNILLSMDKVEKPVDAGQQTNATTASSMQHLRTSAGAGIKIGSNKEVQMQKAEASAGNENTSYQVESNSTCWENTLTSFQKGVESHIVPAPINDQECGKPNEENFYVRNVKDTDISDAVELSISASEALVIHELVNSGSASEGLPTASLLEAALHVKRARLEGLEYVFENPTMETDEINYLSDLDDLTMAEMYDDVGLFFSGNDDKHLSSSDASLVKETPLSENHFECTNDYKIVDLESECAKLPIDCAVDQNTYHLPRHGDPMLPQSNNNISHDSAVQQSVGSVTRGHLLQPEASTNSPNAKNPDNCAEREELGYLVSDRFASRWFGGWTAKEVNAPAQLQQNNNKIISKLQVKETSFLSESADIAPDENSFVQKDETLFRKASESSVPFEGLNNTGDVGNLMSQDVSCSNLSMVDPLCSAVPCSISSVNTNGPSAQNQFVVEETPDEVDPKTSDLNSCEKQDMPAVPKAGSQASVQRQLTSLKTFSTLLPKYDTNLGSKSIFRYQSLPSKCNEEYISLEHNMGCIQSPEERWSKGTEPLWAASKHFVDRDNKCSGNTATMKNPLEGTTRNTTSSEDEQNEAQLQFQPLEESGSPIMLNRKRHCCLGTSKLLTDSSSEKENPKETREPEAINSLHQNSSSQNIQSDCHNPLETQFPAKKRVHFSKVDTEIQQNYGIERQQSVGSTRRASKRSKSSSTKLDSRTYDLKSYFTTQIHQKKLIFDGIKFLLTGFSVQKEKEIERLVQQNGGIVLDIPHPSWIKRGSKSNFQQLPVVLCPKKLKTTKFLYGCAVNAFILGVKWLTDSLAAGSVVSPTKYLIIPMHADLTVMRIGKPVRLGSRIFDSVGIMLHGKHSFCTKFTILFKHGGGQAFKTLQWLVRSLDNEKISVGAIIAEDENKVSRHLRHCAYERKISVTSVSWIIKCLQSRKLLPFTQSNCNPLSTVKVPEIPVSLDWSQEI